MTLLNITQQKLNSINNRITNIIIQNTDEETGEISERVLEDLEHLELSKQEIIKTCGLSFHQYKLLSEQVTAEKGRLNDLEKNYKKSMESFKNLMSNILQGDTYECENFKCTWRKSTSFDLVENADIDLIPDEFVRVKKELDKTKVKDHYKNSGVLPENVIKKENKNLVIK